MPLTLHEQGGLSSFDASLLQQVDPEVQSAIEVRRSHRVVFSFTRYPQAAVYLPWAGQGL